MEVSAQVTFVIWILECVSILCSSIVWKFIYYGKTGPGTLTTTMVWLHIILPYVYLMNTSDNRYLVAHSGWKSTIQNVFGTLNRGKQSEIVIGKSTPDINPITADIYMTNNSKQIIPKNHDVPIHLPNVPLEEQQSTSKLCCGVMHGTEGCNTNHRSDSESDSKSYRRSIGEEIFSYMLSNVQNEDTYLHYFKQLISFEEDLNKEGEPNIFHIAHINYNQNKRKGKIKRCSLDLNNDSGSLTKSKHVRHEILELKVNFIGKQADRTAMRRDMLENVYDHDNDDELYNEFLDQLIVLEESFIEDTS